MSLLRIALGYQTENFREEVPAVIYLGYDGDAARKAAAAAGPEFHRIELVETRGGHRLRKQSPSSPSIIPTSIAPVPPSPAEPEPAVDPEPVAEAPAGEDETSPASGDDDGPSLLPQKRRK